jgi:hypothetical protein
LGLISEIKRLHCRFQVHSGRAKPVRNPDGILGLIELGQRFILSQGNFWVLPSGAKPSMFRHRAQLDSSTPGVTPSHELMQGHFGDWLCVDRTRCDQGNAIA